jgi:drug/metabolite transporter (DMT)-like permease
MQTSAFPYILILSLFWGTNIVASRFGIGEFDPYLFIALRLAIATLFFVPILWLNGRRWPTDRTLWRHGFISGILGVAIPMTSFILSLQYQSSGVASIFVTASPAIIVIMAHFFLPDEKMTRNKAFGLILALFGALFLVLRGESGLADVGRASPLGFILVMIGLVAEGINTMYVRRHMMAVDPMTVTGIRLFVGAVIVLVIVLLVGDFSLTAVTPAGYFSLGYAALIGALAGQFTAFYIQRRFGATAFALTSYLIPIVATTFGVLLLDEIVTWAMFVGIALIGSGIYLISKRTAITVRRMPIR